MRACHEPVVLSSGVHSVCALPIGHEDEDRHSRFVDLYERVPVDPTVEEVSPAHVAALVAAIERASAQLQAMETGQQACKSRDFGRGIATAARMLREALGEHAEAGFE